MGHIASGPKREHVPTAAEREQWKNHVLLEANNSRWSGHGGHQASRFAESERMASSALSTRKKYFHTTTDLQQPVARLEWMARLD